MESAEAVPKSEEQNSIKEESSSSLIINEKGPWYSFPIIASLPPDIEISTIESYDEHVYIGTVTGEILHYFEIECGNYLLVSRTNFNDKTEGSSSSIDKIIILPKIEKACVLSKSELVLFLLPEMAPVPNVERFKGINDMVLRNYPKVNDRNLKNRYELLLFTDESVRNLVVSETGLKQNREFDYKLIETGICHDSIIMSSKLNNYEIINLKTNQVIPLFRISEGNEVNDKENSLKPVIVDFDKKRKFLVCSGGVSYDDNAMVLVLNHQGDITGNVIELANYPNDIVINYPYLLVAYDNRKMEIHKFSEEVTGSIQSVEFSNSKLRLFRTQKTFKNYISADSENSNLDDYPVQKEVIEKLSLVPVDDNTKVVPFDLECKRKFVRDIYDQSSSILVTDNSSLYALSQKPIFLEFQSFEKSQIGLIEDYLENCEELNLKTNFYNQERNYLLLLYLLLVSLHCDTIDKNIIKTWNDSITNVDIRLLLNLLEFRLYGELWIFNGLKTTYAKLKALKLKNKTDNRRETFLEFLSIIKEKVLSLIGTERNKVQNYGDIIKTIDINIFLLNYCQPDSTTFEFDINQFDETSHNEIIDIIKSELTSNESYKLLLIKVYQQKKQFSDVLTLLKVEAESGDEKDILRLLGFIKANVNDFSKTYIENNLLNDIIYIIERLSSSGKKGEIKSSVEDVLKIIKIVKINIDSLLENVARLENGISIKVLILEELGMCEDGKGNTNDKKFLVRYYIDKLHAILEEGELCELFTTFLEDYRHDLKYEKVSIKEYLMTKLKFDDRCIDFVNFYEKIITMYMNDEIIQTLVVEEIKKIDKSNILLILISFGEEKNEFITEEDELNILLENNAFLEIQKHLTKNNFLRIFEHYCKGIKDTNLCVVFLERNIDFLTDDALYKTILMSMPNDSGLYLMGPLILKTLRRKQRILEELEMKKSLIKNEVYIYNDMLKNLGT